MKIKFLQKCVQLVLMLSLISLKPSHAQQPGNCLRFDGSMDHVSLPNSLATAATLSSNNAITISYWFKGSGLLSAVRMQNTNGYIVSGWGMQHIISTDGGTSGVAIPSAVLDGHWHHVAMTWQRGATNGFKSYLDGELVAQRNAANVSLPNITAGAWLGSYGINGEWLNGSLDEVRIYNIALTQANLQTDMVSPISVAPNALLAHYHFNHGNGGGNNWSFTTLRDTSGNNRHGTLTNFALNGGNSNWLGSYAMVRPTSTPATNITSNGFTANWQAPTIGTINSYILDVSTNPFFTGNVAGSPFSNIGSSTLSFNVNNLLPGTYYYRVKSNNNNPIWEGCHSTTQQVTINYPTPGNALDFDGSNDYVNLGNLPLFGAGDFSVMAWVYPKDINGYQIIFAKDLSGDPNSQLRLALNNGNLQMSYINFDLSTSGGKILPNRWNHIAFVKQGNLHSWYINGNLELTHTANTTQGNNNHPWRLGARGNGSAQNPFNGRIDEFQVWNVSRSANEIANAMRNPVNLNAVGLVSYYNFNVGVDKLNNTGADKMVDQKDTTRVATLFNFNLFGTTSNWVESYAGVIPSIAAATNITATSFTANWQSPVIGSVNNYIIDVSRNIGFTQPISGSPFTVAGTANSFNVTGLVANTNYYYRIRPEKTSVNAQAFIGSTQIVRTASGILPPGNCLNLDGTNDYFTVSDATGINDRFPNNNITVEGWFFLRSMPTGAAMPALVTEQYGSNGGTNIKFAIFLFEGKLTAGFHYGSWTRAITENAPPLNRWIHIAATYDKTQIKIYIDGELVATQNSTLNLPPGHEEWRFGRRWDFEQYINGKMDEIRIYNEALTQSQIVSDMRDTSIALPANLVLHYNFDQGIANGNNSNITTLTDNSAGALHNATLLNFALTGSTSNFNTTHAMFMATATPATSVTANGFTANWVAPKIGTPTNYFLDISSSSNFDAPITGSPFTLNATTFTQSVTNLLPGIYYYRVRSGRSSTDTLEPPTSNTISVTINYNKPGNALHFDGVNDFMVVPGAQYSPQTFTYEAWFKTTAAKGNIIGFSTGASFPSTQWDRLLYLNNDGRLFFGVYNGQIQTINSGIPVNDGKWHHVAGTFSRTSGIKLYLDGVLVAENPGIRVPEDYWGYWKIGGQYSWSNGGNFFEGQLDEVKIWTTERTAQQIASGLRNTIPANSSGLYAYYRFDQGVAAAGNSSTNLAIDSTPAARHSELLNFTLTGNTSNWTESYAMVIPTALPATQISANGFTANWTAPSFGSVNSYILEVSSMENFTGMINGYPLNNIGSNTFSAVVNNLPSGGTYYYRIRANKNNMNLQGGASNVIEVSIPYVNPGNALAFDGVNDRLKLRTNAIGNFTNKNFTIEFWMRTSGASGYLITKRNTCGHGSFFNIAQDGGTIGVELDQDPNGTNYLAKNTANVNPVNDGRWHHIAVVRNGVNVRVYIDGEIEGNWNTAGVTWIANTNPIDIGTRYCHNLPYDGSLDELRFWRVARPQDSIRANMRTSVLRDTTGLDAYYDFNTGIAGQVNTGVTSFTDTRNRPELVVDLISFELEALNTNWVESYATVVARIDSVTNVSPNGFTLNWTPASQGVVSNYFIDVSLSKEFTAPISGSPFSVTGGENTFTVSGVSAATYFCRVRANKLNSTTTAHGGPSNVRVIDLKYTPPGNALAFDGNTDNVTFNKTLTAAFSIEFWFKTSMTGATGAGTNIIGNGTTIISLQTNKLRFAIGGTVLVSNTVVNTGQWYHVAATRSSTGELKLYINGQQDVTVSTSPGSLGGDLILAANNSTAFNGAIDELRIWNIERSNSNIVSFYRDTINRNTPGLSEYYNMDQGIGGAVNTGVNTLKDIAGADNGGTLNNFTLSGIVSNWIPTYVQSITPPTALTATQNNCSQITLSWINPTFPASSYELSYINNLNTSGYVPYFKNYVYADDSLVAIVPFDVNSINLNVNEYALNTKLIRGIDYKFKVVTAYIPGTFGYMNFSIPTPVAIGRFKPNPETPSGFTASLGKCDGSIDLSWTWQGTNPQSGFTVIRSSDSSQKDNIETFNLAGTIRSFTNSGLQRGQFYYYRIYARNDCFLPSAVDTMFAGVSDTMAIVGGLSPQVPGRPNNVRLFADSINNIVTVRWNDNSDNEEKFAVERTAVGGITTLFDVNANDTVYYDDAAAGCVAYNYTIRAYSGCATNGIPSIGLNQTRITPNLTNTFNEEGNDTSIYKLKCSKGYYPDRIELTWANRNSSQLNVIRIFRKIANTTNDSVLIASVLSGSGLYLDNSAVAGILYRYFIVGEVQCAGVTRYSNFSSDIGFRSPVGTVSGNITYTGGFAAPGIRVLAQNNSANKGGSIVLDGVNDYLNIKHQESQNPSTNALTIEAWYRPNNSGSFVIVNKYDTAVGGYSLVYHASLNQLWFSVDNGTDSQIVAIESPFAFNGSYNQITAAYAADSMRLYINGMERRTVPTLISHIGLPNTDLHLGGSPSLNIYGNGNLDEVRLWKIAKTGDQIRNDFNRNVERNNGNLFLYLSFDDRFPGLGLTYDQSNLNLVFNENHAQLINGANFSDSIPTPSQLSLASYTDGTGNYKIENMRYLGTGQNYSIVPTLDLHTFSPNSQTVFVGDGSMNVSNVNFLDNSSFEFVGSVKYAGTTCPAAGAYVQIDGQYIFKNNQPVIVNDSGKFVVNVPIGNHVVSLLNPNHTFSNGRFPPMGTYNFVGPVSANFTDSTFLKVVGRVAGGNREFAKKPGMGRGKNNIGKAQFTFTSTGQAGVNQCFNQNVITNDSTGEYTVTLLPLRYNISGLRLVNNPDPTLLTKAELNNPNVLDLTSVPELKREVDTLVTPQFTRIDSVTYHALLDFKYFNTPTIYLTDTLTPYDSLTNNFIGLKHLKVNDTLNVPISNNELGYPIFEQFNEYYGYLKVVEEYQNIDLPAENPNRKDIVPVSGSIRILNNLAAPEHRFVETEIEDGLHYFMFRAGTPNQLINSVNPQYSYTKTLQIEFVPQIGNTINFLPNKNDLVSQFYRGYVLGTISGNANFTTTGPALVDLVLRDPPGSASSATWAKGSSFTTAEAWNVSNAYGANLEGEIKWGFNKVVSVGVGAEVETEFKNEFTIDASVGFSKGFNNEGEIVTTTTINKSISTGGDPGSVGTNADIYFGKAQNITFGLADQIMLIDTASCSLIELQSNGQLGCIGNQYMGFKIAKMKGFYVEPGEIKTTFVYTQDEIINIVIPSLEGLRNQFLTNNILNNRGVKKYVPVFTDLNDPRFSQKFGSNNDDPIWGGQRSTPTPFTREAKDSTGPSYVFHGNNIFEVDSIRYYNNQIRLWKNAIARNEKQKYQTINNTGTTPVPGGINVSIGKAAYTEEFAIQTDETYTENIEWQFSQEFGLSLGYEIDGFGISGRLSANFEQVRGKTKSKTSSVATTFSYTLQDGDDGDLISVDVVDPKDGNSHVFKLRAGQTSCPYEGEERALFFDPSNDTITSSTLLENGFEIQTATAQNDVPVISVDRNNNFNIPADQEAIFILDLGNLSEGRQDRTYSLRVDPASNPHGAILKIDGLDPNRDFDVPYGTTVQKTLTVKRGPTHYDYDNLKLILKSACDDDIFDTVSVNAHFLPTCTSVELKSPEDRWILNNGYRDTLPVVIGGYNYNWGGLRSIQLQYKPGGTNTWYTEKVFYKDTADEKVKIPVGVPNIYYPFNFKNLPDGNYELRAVAECTAPGYPDSRVNSTVMQGLADRVNPTPFGTPSPADGILSANDDISIQFNEPIEQSTLSLSNFEVKGVLNQSDLRNNTSIFLDGNNDFLEVQPGLNLQNNSFTIELWHKRGGLGEQVLVSQGADSAGSTELGFNADNKLYFKVNGETVIANTATTDTTNYQFYAVSFNTVEQTADLFIGNTMVNTGNNRIFGSYNGSGKTYIGRASYGAPRLTKGNVYEVRIWGTARTLAQANLTKNKLLNTAEPGLIANWRMDEGNGKIAKDYARFRHAMLVNAQWFLFPQGKSQYFNGNQSFATTSTTHFGITKEMDFTLEFWFKGNNGNNVALISNGRGNGTDLNPDLKWCIETDSAGRLHVRNNGIDFIATQNNYFDGNWHHLALVMRRSSSLSCYVDATLQNSMPSGSFGQWGGLKMWMGAKGWNNVGSPLLDSTANHFTGYMDDIRFWNTSRLQEQIERDKNYRLMGDENGLVVYVPFESYADVMGVAVLTQSYLQQAATKDTVRVFGGASFSDDAPLIKLPRAAQKINFTYGINLDKIIITPTTANEFIENVTLDITVKNVNDKNGNTMQSPKTWIAYVDKNQVKWQNDSRSFTKLAGAPLSFTETIINSGGALKQFTIGNLPAWLKASVTNATIAPNSKLDITFTVDPTLNIGKYEQDITLLTDFGYPHRLLVKVNTYAQAPDWFVDKGKFQKTMSVVGQVRINNVISSNTEDLLAAFVNNECRGVAKVTYYEQLDKYLVLLDVYGNIENESLEFRIWNASAGKTHIEVDPQLNFVSNQVVGSINTPQIFNAFDKISRNIVLNKGWNWISFNLLMKDSANLNNLFSDITPVIGNQIKSNTQMAIFDTTNGWTGNLANLTTGVKPERTYLFFAGAADTLEIRGVEANPLTRTISHSAGWNYIGYVSQRNISVNEALSAYKATQNDLIKGQSNFAVYDTILGWMGSLQVMVPNQGYMLKSASNGTFNYPRSAMFGKKLPTPALLESKYWKANPHQFAASMNVVATTEACNHLNADNNLYLGAFVNNELRGFAKAMQVGNQYQYYLSIAGKEGESVSYRLLNENNGTEYTLDESANFTASEALGSPIKPILLTKKDVCIDIAKVKEETASVYPVPFNNELTIKTVVANNGSLNARLLDISGKEVSILCQEKALSVGSNLHTFSLNELPAGVYIVEINYNQKTERIKVIKY